MEKMMILPTDIVVEILSWLPARSVGRLRTLSKLYHGLLSQPSFKKKHLCHGSGISSPKLIVEIMAPYQLKKTWNFFYPIDNNITSDTLDASDINYSSYQVVDDAGTYLSNSCNGLFCVEDRKGLLELWNPTTREATCLPESPNEHKLPHEYSFGYDSLNDDYKILCLIHLPEREEVKVKGVRVDTSTFMYSHKGGCWKKIEPFLPYRIQSSLGNNQFVHGKIHWIAYSSPEKDEKVQTQCIVSLDIADERYGTVPLPSNYRYHSGKDINVCVLGGELCVYINGGYGKGFEVWMMREYSVEQSWFQLLTIPFHNLRYSTHGGSAICKPFFLLKSGEILLLAKEHLGSSIYLYNPKTCNFVTVHTVIPYYFICHRLFGQIYVESLVETAISYKDQSSAALA